MLGYRLQKRATSAIWASESCSKAVLSSSSISMMSKMLSTPWGREQGEDSSSTLVRKQELGSLRDKKPLMYLFRAALDVLRREEGQLFEVRVLGPHGLGDHLCEFHSCQCRTQPAITRQHINAGLDQTNRLQTQQLGQIHTQESKPEV